MSSDDAPSESVGPNEKCVNKVMMVEETEYTEEVIMMMMMMMIRQPFSKA